MPPVARTLPRRHPRTAVVVGAGVTGLVAAWRLRQQGVRVTTVEAATRAGGQVRTTTFGGRPLELGAESLRVVTPSTWAVLDELRLATTALTADLGAPWIETGRGLRRLPAGVGPSGPTRLGPVLRSRTLSTRGLARAALEPWYARHHRVLDDMAVGDYVAARFGRQVAERLVDPLLGAVSGGDIHRLSLHACDPRLHSARPSGRRLGVRRSGRPKAPGFPEAVVTWPAGLQALVDALLDAAGPDVLLGTPVRRVERAHGDDDAYVVRLGDGESLLTDAVVLAVPAAVAADLLQDVAPGVGPLLRPTPTASVATILAAIPRPMAMDCVPLQGTGVLVPSSSPRTLEAATFLTTKWPHLADADTFLVRLSAGRAGSTVADTLTDDELVVAVFDDLSDVTGCPLAPLHALVHRWPQALPQLEVGHMDRMRAVRALLSGLPGLALAGAAFDGVGLAAALRSGEVAAAQVTSQTAPRASGASTRWAPTA